MLVGISVNPISRKICRYSALTFSSGWRQPELGSTPRLFRL